MVALMLHADDLSQDKPGSPPSLTALFLHGILGRGRNWHRIARSLLDQTPAIRCVTLDLPGHGQSPATEFYTVDAAAAEVADWVQANTQGRILLAGHSYGGKVAMVASSALLDRLSALWIIDATPSPVPNGQGPWLVLDVLERVTGPFASRTDAASQLTHAGLPHDIAQWLVSNLVQDPAGFQWSFNPAVLRAYLDDYGHVDLWPIIQNTAKQTDVHILRALRSDLITPDAIARLKSLSPQRPVQIHALDGGHWIHTEQPDNVVRLLAEHLPG